MASMPERKPTPRDFPVLSTPRRWMEIHRGTWPPRSAGVCQVCGLAMDPRLVQRHAKACARRKRLAPELWREWHADMHQLPMPCQHCGVKMPRTALEWDAGAWHCTDAEACARRAARAAERAARRQQ